MRKHEARIVKLETELANAVARNALLESLLEVSQEDLRVARVWYERQVAELNARIAGVLSSDEWRTYSPKNGDVTAVKLTRDNFGPVIHRVRQAGVNVLLIGDDFFTLPSGSVLVGDWLLEDWDYGRGLPVYRVASSNERDWFDLR